ncbi:type IX secretion system protein PorG [Flavobacterium sp.]|uniref:type IX secretion system protein PorG n=1 Tax=Flavobacterium sp. TaxID=239 RepID=UPI002FDC7EE1
MKRILVLFFGLIFQNFLNAQIHEIGLFLGGSNFIGDVGKTNYISPNEPAIGILYKWNKSPRHSYRFSYTQTTLSGNDADSEVPGRYARGYRFKNNIKELSAGMEFNFFEFNLHEELDKIVTPYVYTGLAYFAYNELYVVNGITKKDYTEGSLAIPMTVGIKSNVIKNFVLGLEVGARYTFTDNLDGSLPKNENLAPLQFGNINSKDWYVFTGFTLTYTFGDKPCYCAE